MDKLNDHFIDFHCQGPKLGAMSISDHFAKKPNCTQPKWPSMVSILNLERFFSVCGTRADITRVIIEVEKTKNIISFHLYYNNSVLASLRVPP